MTDYVERRSAHEVLACTGSRTMPVPAGLGVPASAVRDARVDLDDLWPADRVRRLGHDLAAAPSALAAEQVLAAAVAAVGGEWDPAAPRLLELVSRGERVATVADAL